MTEEQQNMVPADPAKRRQALLALLVMTVVGALYLYGVQFHLAQVNLALDAEDHQLANRQIRHLGALILGGLLIAGIGLTWWMETTIRRSLAQDRFPPEGMAVLRATPIRRGAVLKRLAFYTRVGAALLITITVALCGWFSWLLYRLF